MTRECRRPSSRSCHQTAVMWDCIITSSTQYWYSIFRKPKKWKKCRKPKQAGQCKVALSWLVLLFSLQWCPKWWSPQGTCPRCRVATSGLCAKPRAPRLLISSGTLICSPATMRWGKLVRDSQSSSVFYRSASRGPAVQTLWRWTPVGTSWSVERPICVPMFHLLS